MRCSKHRHNAYSVISSRHFKTVLFRFFFHWNIEVVFLCIIISLGEKKNKLFIKYCLNDQGKKIVISSLRWKHKVILWNQQFNFSRYFKNISKRFKEFPTRKKKPGSVLWLQVLPVSGPSCASCYCHYSQHLLRAGHKAWSLLLPPGPEVCSLCTLSMGHSWTVSDGGHRCLLTVAALKK